MEKIVDIDGRLVSRRLSVIEPTVQILRLGHNNGVKTASEASDWARSVKPKDGKTYILVLALGASEWYGPNRNGDGFREEELIRRHKTFETDAHVFRSHVNKDPAKSFGKVVKSFYNNDMHRVELVLEIDNEKAPDIVEKINNGEQVAVSMGCRIKHDVCSICGNKAPKRDDYCDHAKFQLNDILPDGRLVYVDNPDPTFFDISVVWRPADRTGYMLKKVADYHHREFVGSSAELAEKVAGRTVLASLLRKMADIDKVVTGVGIGSEASKSGITGQWVDKVVPKVLSNYKPIENKDLGWLSGQNFPQVLASLSEMGIFLSTPEFLDILFLKMTGRPAPRGFVRNLISLQGDMFRMLADSPKVVEFVMDSGLLGSASCGPSDVIMKKMSSYIPSRSWTDTNIKLASSNPNPRRSKLAYGQLETVSYTDPYTGKVYVTTKDSVEAAESVGEVSDSLGLLGSLALAGGTYLALSPFVQGSTAKLIPSALAGMLSVPYTMGQNKIVTDSGEEVPAITSFTERRASWEPRAALMLSANYMHSRPSINKSRPAKSLLKTASAVGDSINVDALVNNLGYLLSLG
jgi:hypothetical protein